LAFLVFLRPDIMANTIDTAKLALISQGAAYGLLIGLSVVFCGVILVAVKVQKAYLAEDSGKSEMFMVANRSVGRGLTASAVFSSWMWINETVLCASMCYRYGLAVPLVCGFQSFWLIVLD
jgi:Na+/proline symporter